MVVSCALAHRFSSVVDTVVVIIVGFIAPLCTTYFPAVHIHTPCHDSHSFYARDTHFSRALRHPVLHIDDFYFTSPSSFILYLIYISLLTSPPSLPLHSDTPSSTCCGFITFMVRLPLYSLPTYLCMYVLCESEKRTRLIIACVQFIERCERIR